MLVNGKWISNWNPAQTKDKKGGFQRQDSSFRHWIGKTQYPAKTNRYHLYAALICPWACRTLALRNLKGLQDIIPVTIVEPVMTDYGWKFGNYPGASGKDPVLGASHLYELYIKSDANYTGRATIPVLWDTESMTIVNNESSEIIKMFNNAFDELLPENKRKQNLYPERLQHDIDAFNEDIYPTINNGVYRAGFATTQTAYEEAFHALFSKLDELEKYFSDGRKFVHGDVLTLSDIHLFPTLIRFDAAYYGAFKVNWRHITDYPSLQRFIIEMMQIPEIASTVNFQHIKAGYYSIKAINPSGIIPVGPELKFQP